MVRIVCLMSYVKIGNSGVIDLHVYSHRLDFRHIYILKVALPIPNLFGGRRCFTLLLKQSILIIKFSL